MMNRLIALAGTLVLVSGATAATFDFEDFATSTTAPFSSTVGGITATFSSPTGNLYLVTPSTFSTLSGQTLRESDPTQGTLEIAFDIALTSASVRFGFNPTLPGAPPDYNPPMNLRAYLGSVLVGSTDALGTRPGGPFSDIEGVVSFQGVFDRLQLGVAAFDFAVDDVSVTPVPEPGAVPLFLLGTLALGARFLSKRA